MARNFSTTNRNYAKLFHQRRSNRVEPCNMQVILMKLDWVCSWKVRSVLETAIWHKLLLSFEQSTDVTVSGSVLSILCLAPLLIVAVGFEDGKMLLYDLCTLDAFHIAHPPEDDSPLEKLTFIEPADDPRACVYVWSFHSNNTNAIAVLHSLTYEMKIVKPNGNGFVYKVWCCLM